MTAPRASLLRRLSWWLRGGPARVHARSCRRSGIPAGDAAILGWCIMANSTIVLLPLGMAVAIALGAVRGSQQPARTPLPFRDLLLRLASLSSTPSSTPAPSGSPSSWSKPPQSNPSPEASREL